ncbi:MAG TPA: hypothetical protein VE172_12980 [Stackebrandtia sp.]|jgi:hypothetical protein|uniref:2'-5' RNA ligase family protein n=1 Tax=Stackebrandtia sp. TaxID=2023065 RepID=UPI002D491C86|nr:hypothetical protein [Stackebrandtia sp.]HZE39714.1 hypothetical protein [Stackebrandtia sp.]
MTSNAQFHDRGRADVLAGRLSCETPPVDGGPRWGLSAVFRPTGPVAEELAALGREATAVAGPGHWVHGPRAMHTTLRALEPHSTRNMVADARVGVYAEALAAACRGFAPIELEFRGIAPHGGGVMAQGIGRPQGFPALRRRYVDELDARGVAHYEQGFVRDIWYVSLLHFAAPVPDPAALVRWGDRLRDRPIGTVMYDEAEIIRWHLIDGAITAQSLFSAKLDG